MNEPTPEQLQGDASYLECQADLSPFQKQPVRFRRIAAYLRASCPLSLLEPYLRIIESRISKQDRCNCAVCVERRELLSKFNPYREERQDGK